MTWQTPAVGQPRDPLRFEVHFEAADTDPGFGHHLIEDAVVTLAGVELHRERVARSPHIADHIAREHHTEHAMSKFATRLASVLRHHNP
jgi:hypothetical protein